MKAFIREEIPKNQESEYCENYSVDYRDENQQRQSIIFYTKKKGKHKEIEKVFKSKFKNLEIINIKYQ